MTKFDRLLAPGSTEMPDCKCGAEMQFARSIQTDNSSDTEIRVYECAACGHEFRLMVWIDAPDSTAPVGSL
jgi:hypothetical protein